MSKPAPSIPLFDADNHYISPFWEEDLGALAELIGVGHVLFGSDDPVTR
jgi:hypothetical protein